MKKQLNLFIALFIGIISCSYSQDKTPLNIKTGCVSGNCENGFGTFVNKSGALYIGSFKNNLRQGKGIFYFINGDIYNGDWDSSKNTGVGSYIFKAGTRYEGEFKNGNRDGYGVYFNANGSVNYAGQWNNNIHANFPKDKTGCIFGDCANGFGIYVWATGAVYKGNFKNDSVEGDGTYYTAAGDVWDGECKKGKPNGWGIYYFKDGAYYEGEMKDAVNSGWGTLFNEDGTVKHIGNWINGKIADSIPIKSGCIDGDCENGIGEIIYVNGDRYIGKFTNSQPDSSGRYVNTKGDIFDCQWKNVKPQGYGYFYYGSTGYWYIGQVSGFELNGFGVLFNKDGTINFAGEFKNNLPVYTQKPVIVDKPIQKIAPTPFAEAINILVNDAEEDFITIRGDKGKYGNKLYPQPKILIEGCLTAEVYDPEQAPFAYMANIIETQDKDSSLNKYNEFLNILKNNKAKINDGFLTIEELIYSDAAKFDRGQVADVMIASKTANVKGERPMIIIEVRITCTQNSYDKKYSVNLSVSKHFE